MRFHHVGLLTSEPDACAAIYEALGYARAVDVEDPIQRARVMLMTREGEPIVEIVTPLGPESPASSWLKRTKAGPYHTCYEVDALEPAMERLRDLGFGTTAPPAPAVAFEGRRVVFLYAPVAGLVELVEASRWAIV